MRKAFLKIHLYLGLMSGLVVFIVSVTGCLWVFKDEIQSLYQPTTSVPVQDLTIIPPTKAREAAQKIFPDKAVHGTQYKRPGEAVEVIFYQAAPEEFYQSVFLHPYTAQVLHIENHTSGFFAFVLDGHLRLWLPEKAGSNIVGISVLLFLVILISGLILWWPRGRNRRQRFFYSWKNNTQWKRKNFDLHSVTGFYILSLAFVLAFTGSVMAFDWFSDFSYRAAGGEKVSQFIIPENKQRMTISNEKAQLPIDYLIQRLREENPEAESFEVHYPYSSASSIYVEISKKRGVYYSSDYRFFDQYTLEELETPSIYGPYKDAGFAEKVIRMNYDIHVGAIGGFAGKLIAFFISLITATLPVSGFLIWYGRNHKKRSVVPAEVPIYTSGV